MNPQLHIGDCLNVMRTLPDNSVDSVVTDPPYGLSFMGKKWDYDVPREEIWRECLRVLKPGGHLLAFAGTRTQHRMAVRIEDAGFEIRDMIAWVYGSGFPKSHNLKDEWQGWGTALKPALEPITVARKPLIGTVAENVLAHGTGALNIDGARVAMSQSDKEFILKTARPNSAGKVHIGDVMNRPPAPTVNVHDAGRWPANLIHDGSEEVTQLLGDSARFFYCAKASKRDRDEGLEGFVHRPRQTMGNGIGGQPDQDIANSRNLHPTVKPTDLMRYLVRLVTQPGGVVLDPFMGSGSTGKACALEGLEFIGIELDPEYSKIAAARIAAVTQGRLAL